MMLEYTRNKPCNDCPFRTDRPFRGLTKERAIEIHNSIHNDGFFPCHKYIDYPNKDKRTCIGSVIYLENQNGVFCNWTYRVASLICGDFDLETLDYSIPIASSLEKFISVSTISQ